MAKAQVETPDGEAPKKKGKKKLLMLVGAFVVIGGGGAGGALYAMQSGLLGGGATVKVDNGPHLVPKSLEKRASASGEGGGESKSGGSSNNAPLGTGGEKYASTYYTIDKEFTSNLRDSVHFIQVGIAVSTPYDERVIENLKTHEIAVRSAILMALGDANEDQVFTNEGKRALQVHLAHAINDVLKQKEGFGGISNVYFTNFVVQ
ncbi:flagellar basal body-associated FliL family protein [Sphingomonas sp. GlSt437]|uniref:flagellar basal body-associated FliL family protein n=1 Tax=Sphingomonas sp. GlSt437 TaxID=3389970 RepID=UPI003A86542A